MICEYKNWIITIMAYAAGEDPYKEYETDLGKVLFWTLVFAICVIFVLWWAIPIRLLSKKKFYCMRVEEERS